MPKLLRQVAKGVGVSVVKASKPLIRATTFTVDTFRAHHRLIGKKLIPNLDENAPKVKELNKFGQAALTIIPVIPASWLTSVTLTPLLYYGLVTNNKTCTSIINLSLSGLEESSKLEPAQVDLGITGRVYGLPGYVTGTLLGIPGAALVLGARTIPNNIKSTRNACIATVNLALGDEHFKPSENKRSRLGKVLGLPGYPVGVLLGGSYLAFYKTKPVALNSLYTYDALEKQVANLVLTDFNHTLTSDSRTPWEMYGLGMPGLVIGAGFAPLVLTTASTLRVLKENHKSFINAFLSFDKSDNESKKTPDSAVTDHENTEQLPQDTAPAKISEKHRSKLLKYGVGLPGFVMGKTTGFILTGDIFHHSLVTMLESTRSAVQPVMSNTKSLDYLLDDIESRTAMQKYVQGAPGLVLSTVPISIFYSTWILGNSIRSWRALSGSLLNGATDVRLCGGLAADERKRINKLLGMPGYAASLITVAPITTGVFAVWVVGHGALFVTSGALSPIVAAYKANRRYHHKTRFEGDELPQFQNIYGMLTISGDLPEGKAMKENLSGNENLFAFLRHSFTLDTSSMTEEILDKMLKAYRASDSKETFFTHGEYRDVIAKIKRRHFLETNDDCIEDIVTFIEQYASGQTHSVPENLYANEHSWWKTFKGHPRNQQPIEIIYADQPDITESTVSSASLASAGIG